MENTLQVYRQKEGHGCHAPLLVGISWGLIGGLAGTLFMDFVLIGALSLAGLSPFTCFSIVGDTVARFFSVLGTQMVGTILLGVATHYLIGPLVGVIFGLALARVAAFRGITLKKSILFGILYVEILSQPLLAMTPVLLKTPAATTLLWYGGSSVMHFLLGAFLGAVVTYGLHRDIPEKEK